MDQAMNTTTRDPVLDVAFCRSHFPAVQNGWTYLDNAGGSYVPRSVMERMSAFLGEYRNQPYEHFGPGKLAKDRLDATYSGIAELINADKEEVVIGPSTTANIFVLSQAVRKVISAGDEIIVTNQDHETNIGAWRRLGEFGVKIVEWKIDPETGLLSMGDLRRLISKRTKLICITHASNVVAAINPIAEIAALAHDAGARVCVDGVAYAPHALVDVKALDVDFYFFSLYKVYGPHLGVFYGKREAVEETANQNHFFYEGHRPQMLHPTGDQYEAVGAASGILDYFDSVYAHHFGDGESSIRKRTARIFDLFEAAELASGAKLMNYLTSKRGVRVLGPQTGDRTKRMPTIAFTAGNKSSKEIATSLAKKKIAVAFGNFYSVRCLEALGIKDLSDGVVRISLVHYNTLQEVDRVIEALEAALG
jgi:cysteine desulfurase family protein (TIGR01976 family)